LIDSSSEFSGWRVVLSLSVSQACGVGLLQAYSPLLNPIARAFDMSPGEVGAGMSILIVTLALVGVVIGPAIDRGWVRSLMLGGVALMAIGLLGFSRASEPWHLAVGMIVASIGLALYGPLPANATIVRWFLRRRGTALAISSAGPAVAGFGIPIGVAWMIDAEGWRTAIQVLALGAAVIALPVISFGVVGRPEEQGQTQDGLPADPVEEPVTGAEASPRSWLGDRDFWFLAAGIGLIFAVPVGMGLYLVPFLEEAGISTQRAALSVSVAAVFAFAGTLGSGALVDRFPPKLVLFVFLGLFAASYVAVATWPTFTVALVAAAGMGLGTGGAAPLHALFVGRRFGPDVVASVMGIQGLIGLPLLASAPLLAGAVRSATGAYEPAFLGAAVVILVAGVFIGMFRLDPPEPKDSGGAG
jgi:predicted MFS family arabinose efflux permease